MLDVTTAALVAATILSFAVILPQQLGQWGQLRRTRDGREAFAVIVTALIASLLLALILSPWAYLALAIGLWALAFVFVAMQMEEVRWLWSWWWQYDTEEDLFTEQSYFMKAVKRYENLDLGSFDVGRIQHQSTLPEENEEE